MIVDVRENEIPQYFRCRCFRSALQEQRCKSADTFSLTLTLSRWEREHCRPRLEYHDDLGRSSIKGFNFKIGGDQYLLSQRERIEVRESR